MEVLIRVSYNGSSPSNHLGDLATYRYYRLLRKPDRAELCFKAYLFLRYWMMGISGKGDGPEWMGQFPGQISCATGDHSRLSASAKASGGV